MCVNTVLIYHGHKRSLDYNNMYLYDVSNLVGAYGKSVK